MTRDDIVRWFRRFRYDPEYRGTVPITRLCQYAGIPRENLYQIMRGDLGLSDNYRRRLEAAIQAVEAGLRWHRRGRFLVMSDPQRFQALPRYERPKHRPAA
jgi:hypothetical protein